MTKKNSESLVEVKRDLSKEESDIIDAFHRVIFKLLKICKKMEPNNIEVEWLHNKLSLARNVDPLLIITRCKEKIWTYRNEILERNTDFFVKNKFSQFVKNDENKTFMYTLINLLKKKFMELSDEERSAIWDLANELLVCVIKFMKIEAEKKDKQ